MALLNRLYKYFAAPATDAATLALYTACVAQVRMAAFYESFGVPDSVDGRFDMLLLHVWLVMRRLDGHAGARQGLFDILFKDMDRSLREMGVGDMSIGKKIKPMISAFYGRAQAYDKALSEGDAVLASTLQRNLCGASGTAEQGARLGAYVRRAEAALKAQPVENLLAGQVTFPEAI